MEKDSVVPAATWYRGLAGDKLITHLLLEKPIFMLRKSNQTSVGRFASRVSGFQPSQLFQNLPAQSLTKPFFRRFSQRHGVTPVLLDRRKFLSSQHWRVLCIRSIHFKILPRKEMLQLIQWEKKIHCSGLWSHTLVSYPNSQRSKHLPSGQEPRQWKIHKL